MPAADLQLAALFRREAGSICAWLVRLLGPARLDLIEDAVQDAFSAALVQWPLEGTPQRPAAWLAERLPGLLNAIYLLFNGGYTAAEGEPLMAQELCAEALRLATLLTQHAATATGETHALAALMCFHHARAAARTGERGDLVLLAEQDRSRWDHALIAQGFVHLRGAMSSSALTPLHLEAGIASVHAGARRFQDTDWAALARYYDP